MASPVTNGQPERIATPDVARDGSPVAVYLALPRDPDLTRIRSVLRPHSSVLDLGAGVGRIANALAAEGHDVVAVDDSAEMLEHVTGVERVLADVWALDLNRGFDVVLALSHLINDRTAARRLGLLRVCRTHLRDGGTVVVQRYPPDWKPAEETSRVGDVEVHLHDIRELTDGFAATVTYAIGDRLWAQSFEAAIVDDDDLRSLAEAVGLSFGGVLDEHGAWVLLTAA